MGKWTFTGIAAGVVWAVVVFAMTDSGPGKILMVLGIVPALIGWYVDGLEKKREDWDRAEQERLQARNLQAQRFERDWKNRLSHKTWPVQTPVARMSSGFGSDIPTHLHNPSLPIPAPREGDKEYDNRTYGVWNDQGERIG